MVLTDQTCLKKYSLKVRSKVSCTQQRIRIAIQRILPSRFSLKSSQYILIKNTSDTTAEYPIANHCIQSYGTAQIKVVKMKDEKEQPQIPAVTASGLVFSCNPYRLSRNFVSNGNPIPIPYKIIAATGTNLKLYSNFSSSELRMYLSKFPAMKTVHTIVVKIQKGPYRSGASLKVE